MDIRKKFILFLAGWLLVLPGCSTPAIATAPALSPSPRMSPTPTPVIKPSVSLSPTPVVKPSVPISPIPSETSLNLAQVASDMDLAQSRIQDIITIYPTYTSKTLEGNPTVIKYNMITLKNGAWVEPILIENMKDALIHIANASSLASKGKLPTEAQSRAVTPSELANEVRAAVTDLKSQSALVSEKETKIVAWIANYNEYRLTIEPLPESITPEYQKQSIEDATQFCEGLNSELAIILSQLENTLTIIEAA